MQKLTDENVNSFHPVLLIIFLGLLIFLGLIAFNSISLVLIGLTYGYSFDELASILLDPIGNPEMKVPLLIIQGITALGSFILVPLFFMRSFLKKGIGMFFSLPKTNLFKIIIIVFAIMISFMVINSIAIYFNEKMVLPEFLSWLEEIIKSKEVELEKLTIFLTEFENTDQFILALLVIAVLPAIGEELLFRGIFQNLFNSWLKNPQAAIWITAFLFSVFHFQFYGLIPRMLLGALFGYLYWWSGNLTIAMFGHFINNGFMLIMLYLFQTELIEYNIQDDSSLPNIATLVFFFILTAGLLYFFYKNFKKEQNGPMAEGL